MSETESGGGEVFGGIDLSGAAPGRAVRVGELPATRAALAARMQADFRLACPDTSDVIAAGFTAAEAARVQRWFGLMRLDYAERWQVLDAVRGPQAQPQPPIDIKALAEQLIDYQRDGGRLVLDAVSTPAPGRACESGHGQSSGHSSPGREGRASPPESDRPVAGSRPSARDYGDLDQLVTRLRRQQGLPPLAWSELDRVIGL